MSEIIFFIFIFIMIAIFINIKKQKSKKQNQKNRYIKNRYIKNKPNYEKINLCNKISNDKPKKLTYKERIEKGKKFEIFIGKRLEKKGYKVDYNGERKGKKDDGIDLVAYMRNITLLVQCKNWKADGRKIKHNHLKEFLGNCEVYIEKNNQNKENKIVKVFCTSNYILDKSAEKFIEENKKIIRHEVIEFY